MYDRRSRLAAHAQQGVLVPQQAQLADEALVFLHGALLLRGKPCGLGAQPLRFSVQTLHLRRRFIFGLSAYTGRRLRHTVFATLTRVVVTMLPSGLHEIQ